MASVQKEQIDVIKESLQAVYKLLISTGSPEQVNQATELVEKLNFSSDSNSEKFSSELELLWSRYQQPKVTVLEHISTYEAYRLELTKKGQTPPDYRDCFAIQNGAYYALDPATANISPAPLVFPEEPKYEDFVPEIEKSPISGVMCLVTTIKRFLSRSERCGMTRDHVALMLKELVKREMPEFYSGIKNIADPMVLFKKVTSFTDFTSEKDKITQAIGNIVRMPGESVVRAANIHNSLCQDLVRLEAADLSEEEVQKRADRETSRILRQLVEPVTWNALQIHVSERMSTFKQKTSLEQQIRFIMKEELKMDNRIVNAKKLRRTDVSVALFNTTHMNLPKQPDNMYFDCHGQLCHDETQEEFSFGLKRTPVKPQLNGNQSANRPGHYENFHPNTRSQGLSPGQLETLHRFGNRPSPASSVRGASGPAESPVVARNQTESEEVAAARKSPRDNLEEVVQPRTDNVRGRPQSRGPKLYHRSPGGTFRSASRSRVYIRDRSKSGPRERTRSHTPVRRPGSQTRSGATGRAETRSPSGERQVAPCKLCGFYPGKRHRELKMCPVFGRCKPSVSFCGKCLQLKGVHAYHPEAVCINSDTPAQLNSALN